MQRVPCNSQHRVDKTSTNTLAYKKSTNITEWTAGASPAPQMPCLASTSKIATFTLNLEAKALKNCKKTLTNHYRSPDAAVQNFEQELEVIVSVLFFPSPEIGKWHLWMIMDPLRTSQHPRLEAPHQPDTHIAWNSRPTKCNLLSKGVLTALFHACNYSSATSASAAGSVALAFWSSFVFLRRTDLIPNHRTHEWILQVSQSSGHTLASPTGGSWVQTSKTCGGCCISRANLRGLLHNLQCAPSGRNQHHKHRRCTPFIACMTQNVMAAQDKKRRNFSKRQKWPIAVEERIQHRQRHKGMAHTVGNGCKRTVGNDFDRLGKLACSWEPSGKSKEKLSI